MSLQDDMFDVNNALKQFVKHGNHSIGSHSILESFENICRAITELETEVDKLKASNVDYKTALRVLIRLREPRKKK